MVNIPMMDSYLESVAGYIFDEDKIVTYKWLSKELEVHVNVAKIILWRFFEQYKDKELVASFMLIGRLINGEMRVEVVKDADMIKAKEKFERVMSEHVYSLQKTLPDIRLLAVAGKGDSKYSAIKCAKDVLLSEEELEKLRWGKVSVTLQATSADKKAQNATSKDKTVLKAQKPTEQVDNGTAQKSDEKAETTTSPPSKHKGNEKKGAFSKKPAQSSKTGYGNLFGKAIEQQKTRAAFHEETIKNGSKESNKADTKSSKLETDRSEKTKEKEKSSETQGKNGKSDENEKNSSSSKKNDDGTREREKNSDLSEKNSSSSPPNEAISKKNDRSSKKTEKSSSGKKTVGKKNDKVRGTKRDRSEDNDSEKKKRKRIFVAPDSSDGSAEPSDAEDMFESPPREPAPEVKERSPSPIITEPEGNNCKVRKLVDQTYIDGVGFLVTKKVHVYESRPTEQPEDAEKNHEPEPKVPKESKLNVKKKQTTLMNFFKKS